MLGALQTLSPLKLYGFFLSYLFLRAIVLCSFFFALARAASHRKISKAPLARGQIRSEILANARVNVLEALLFGSVVYFGLVQDHAFTALRFVGTFAFCYAFFEFWFYGVHRVLHSRAFRKLHRQHHRSVVTTPLSAQSASIGEKFLNGIGLIVIPGLLTFRFPLVFEGLFAYHLYNYTVNVLGHSNLEFFSPGYEKTRIGRILATATYHSIHHDRGVANYGLFTSVPDKLFGTYATAYPEVFRKR